MTHLHLHTTYSFLDGFGLPAVIIKKIAGMGQKAAAITDHGVTSGWVQWGVACKEAGIKPIYGCEFYVTDDIKKNSQKKFHLTLLAKNVTGYQNILKLASKAWTEGFYYKPTVDWDMIRQYSKGVIALSGCISSKLSKMALDGDKDIEAELERQRAIFDDYFIEVSPMKFKQGTETIKALFALAKKYNIPTAAACDSHYVNKEDAKLQELLLAIQSNAKWEDPLRWKFDQDDFYVKSHEEMVTDMRTCFPEFADEAEASVNFTDKVADLVEEFEMPKAENMKFPTERDKTELLREMAFQGIAARLYNGATEEIPTEYVERLNYELDLIKSKGFEDYFLIIADLIVWAKEHDILVGPARGSSAGSLVCYAIRITEVNPIQYELMFERFIDINRIDPPDIDIDFQDDKRHLIKEYLSQKYGRDNFAGIATFIKFKGKLIIQDIARVFSIPENVVATLRPLFVDRSGGDSRASLVVTDVFKEFDVAKKILEQYPEFEMAAKMEGQLRQYSSHAAGVVISNEPLQNFVSMYERDGERIIQLEKYDGEKLGLLKIDLLGLSTLTTVKRACALIKERHNAIIDLYNMPHDDPAVYAKFREGKLFGVFQFEGDGLYMVTKEVQPESFKHLSDIMALARPGPLHSGSTNKYIQRKRSGEKWKESHPLVEELSKDTYGVIIYQEQVMRIMREIGLLSWEDANKLRKIMSNRLGVEGFNRYKSKFDAGALSQGMTQEQTDEVWNSVCTFGSWAMNKSHTISYSILSYWTMWLKVHYPIEYYAAIFETSDNDERVRKVLKEFRREGFQVLDPDVNKSKAKFSICDEGIIIGLADISGIGVKAAQKIVDKQPFTASTEIGVSEGVLTKLERVGALRSISGKSSKQGSLFEATESAYTWLRPSDVDLLGMCPAMVPDMVNERVKKEAREKFKVRIRSITDINFEESNEDITIIGTLSKRNLKDLNEVSASRGQQGAKDQKHPELVKYVNFNMEDDTDAVLVTVNRYNYPHLQAAVWKIRDFKDIILITASNRAGIRKLYAKKIYNLTTGEVAEIPPRKKYTSRYSGWRR